MKITKISASYSVKKQIHQYEPINVSMGAEAEIIETEVVVDAQEELFNIVKIMVEKVIQKIV